MAAILGGGWQPAPGEGALDEDAAWAAWDSAPDPVSRAARFGLPAFRAAQAAVLHLIRLGGQRATSLEERQMLAGHHAAITAAAANLPGAGRRRRGPALERPEVPRQQPRRPPGAPGSAAQPAAGRRAPGHRPAAGTPDRAGPPGPAAVPALRDPWHNWPARPRAAARPAAAGGPGPAGGLGEARPARPWGCGDLGYLMTGQPAGGPHAARPRDATVAYLGYLGPRPCRPELTDRLLNLIIAERALQPADPGIDQPVEFIQVSANTRTSLAPETRPASSAASNCTTSRPSTRVPGGPTTGCGGGSTAAAGWCTSCSTRAASWPSSKIIISGRTGSGRENFASLLRQATGLPDGRTAPPGRRLPGDRPGLPGPAGRPDPGQPAELGPVPGPGLAGAHRGQRAARRRRAHGRGRPADAPGHRPRPGPRGLGEPASTEPRPPARAGSRAGSGPAGTVPAPGAASVSPRPPRRIRGSPPCSP